MRAYRERTEASRSFAALLDEVERGETVVITRGGRRIAMVGPATSGNGAALLTLLASGDIAFDPGYAADVTTVVGVVDDQEPEWARRVVLDTGVVARLDRAVVPSPIEPDDNVVIAAITLAELRAGAELGDADRRAARSASLDRLLEVVPVVPYDAATAQVHGALLAHVHRTGRRRGGHALMVAATATATGRLLLTTDRRARFDGLPGVECVEWS